MKVGVFNNYIDGKWVDAVSGKTAQIKNPCDGEVVTEVAFSEKEDVDLAVAAALRAFKEEQWAYDPITRFSVIHKWAEAIRNSEKLPDMVALETGKPIFEARLEVLSTASNMDYSAETVRQAFGSVSTFNNDVTAILAREPLGVVAGIEPWNFPLTMVARDVAPALAAGNTLVLKPAMQTSGCTMEMVRLLSEIPECPPGVVNVITGSGSNIGPVLSEHKDVEMVVFTGSYEVGKDIVERSAATMKHVSLELGGKSASVLFADANLEKAADVLTSGYCWNAGQTCTAGTRLVLDSSIADTFIEMLKERAESIKMGYCLNEETRMGPIISEAQMSKILAYVEDGKSCSTLVTGGYQYINEECEKGLYLAPTIFLDPPVDSKVVQEEIFGPVLVIQTFETEEEAIKLANCTKYGLASSVWTSNLNRALRVSKALEAGTVWVNNYNIFYPELEMVGFKTSGNDSASGVDGLLKFTQVKNICIDYA